VQGQAADVQVVVVVEVQQIGAAVVGVAQDIQVGVVDVVLVHHVVVVNCCI